jgi:hypothetical protein
MIHRRQLLLGLGAIGLARTSRGATAAGLQLPFNRTTVSVADFGAPPGFTGDATRAIQAAINFVERNGGGTVLIPGRYRIGSVEVSGANVHLLGQGGWLVDGRLTVRPSASNVTVADLGLLDTRGDRQAYLMVVSGRNCRFTNVSLVKDPPAGGYQMYVNPSAWGCRFDGLKLRGSNGIMLAGRDHLFENFEFQAMMQKGAAGDDAFAIKGDGTLTENIVIRNGVVRGYAAIASFGSEIGRRGGKGPPGAVRNVTVENVAADRCTHVAFFKPGAIAYDWRDGLVEQVVLRNLTLNDPTGEYFRTGIEILAARGATVRNVRASGIKILARAMDRGIAPTAAVFIEARDVGAPATIRDVSLQVDFTDPYSGAAHGSGRPGHPVDYVANIQKRNPGKGLVAGITLDIRARGSGKGGIVVGRGLDGAVDISRAVLTRVAASLPQGSNGAGIWSDSRVRLGDITIDSVKRPKFGGSAFAKPSPASTRR